MYNLKIVTWENDGDNYNTHEIRSDDREYIKLIIEIAQLFKSDWSGGKGRVGFGNTELTPYGEIGPEDEAITKIISKYVDAGMKLEDDLQNCYEHQDYSDFLYDEVGIQSWCEGEYWRVFESFKVELLPSEPEDVTEQFKAELG